MHARLVAIAALLAPGVAASAPAPHELRWQRAPGAEGCIDDAELVAAVEQRRGHPLASGAAAVRTIEGRVEPATDGFRVTLVVRDASGELLGERALEEGGDCRRLDESLVLVLSLIIDAEAEAPAVVPAVALAVPPPRRSSWRFAASVSGLGAVGALPGVTVGGDIALDVDAPGLPPLIASFGAWLPEQAAADAGGSRFTALGGGLRACPRLANLGRAELRACGGVAATRIAATGMGFAENLAAVDWIVHGRLEAELVHGLTARVGLVAGAGAWLALVAPRFVYADGSQVREIYAPPLVAGMVRLGVRLAL